jgi:hypothetical protein
MKNGICIVQTPFKDGEIYEDPAVKSWESRLHHFGQKDHVRIYSAKGLEERLSNCGFHVETRDYREEFDNRCGLMIKETILLCTK